VVEGPAIVESEYTTLVVPPAMRFSIDERGLGILES
jgi:N-methylhydantoinase A/oxoprolinase/acetone carboxylase beta subunit